jgi:hypothetical protein
MAHSNTIIPPNSRVSLRKVAETSICSMIGRTSPLQIGQEINFMGHLVRLTFRLLFHQAEFLAAAASNRLNSRAVNQNQGAR